jgi:radical SAM superfamily enzyme YgiQ (UPF0313 family)
MKVLFCCNSDFNLGAAYVIAYLKSIGHEVRLFLDGQSKPVPLLEIQEYSPDLVCISCVTANKDWALGLANTLHNGYRQHRIVFGGVHPTLCPEDFKGYEVCQGDGIKYFGGKFDADKLYPDREIFFEQLPPVHRAYQIFMTGFGCPFKCSYCNNHQLRPKIERRSVEGCIDELVCLQKSGLRYVLFDDDIFTINRSWLLLFLSAYHSRVNLPFTCFGHTKFLDREVASLLKDSGCQCVWLGIQSGDEYTRRDILNRPETNEEIRKACKVVKDAGLKLMIDHIFGIPGDTYDKLSCSYLFYKSLHPDVVNCYELLYFPKSEISRYGHSKALYQKQGGLDYQRYAKSFTAIPLLAG